MNTFNLFKNAVSLLCLLGATTALADDPYLPQCASSYHSDSFGRGIEAVILGGNHRAKLSDEGCYALGADFARQQLANNGGDGNDWECKESFNDGRKEGLEASSESSGVPCYGLGYSAGRADLDIAARQGDASVAGQDCVDAYKQGGGGSSPGFESKVSSCYSLGFFEGPLN